jgi:hypothetical protein
MGPLTFRTYAVALLPFVLVCAASQDARAAEPWVERPLTLPAGNWAFNVGLGLSHVHLDLPAPLPPYDDTGAGINAEMAVGITDRIELGVRGGLRFGDQAERALSGDYYGRPFDRETLWDPFDPGVEGDEVPSNPEVRLRGRLVEERVFELALEGRVVFPFAAGTFAGTLFGVPMAFHVSDRVRLDLGVYIPVFFPRNGAVGGISTPFDAWFQITPRLWLGPMTGLEFAGAFGPATEQTNFSLGFGLGYSILRNLDLKTMFLFPEINNNSGVFGTGVGIEVRIE